jgi:S-(hydroxymethyl)glutathione dehydrogenase/alcohol dehydrogenase
MKTRAAIVENKGGPLRIEEVDLADPGPGEVCIRVEACGTPEQAPKIAKTQPRHPAASPRKIRRRLFPS